MLRIVVHDQEALARLKQSKTGCFVALGSLGKEAGDIILKRLGERAPKGKSGGFGRSFQYRGRAAGSQVTVDVYATGKYNYIAPYIIEGTKPHLIRGNPLHFISKSGEEVFAYTVHHPGTKKNDFVKKAEPDILKDLGAKAEGVIRNLPMFG